MPPYRRGAQFRMIDDIGPGVPLLRMTERFERIWVLVDIR